jgi:hypothetical protein
LVVSYFMTVIDLTIVNVSLPTIGRDLQFSETSLQWVVTAYALTFGGFLLPGGRAADLLGRRRVLMFGLGLFTAASLACGLATGEGFLIGSRAVQGVGAAIMLPAALSIVMIMFEEGAERNKALGIWGGIAAGGATVGLITGGLLTRSARDPTAHRRPTLASSWSSATARPQQRRGNVGRIRRGCGSRPSVAGIYRCYETRISLGWLRDRSLEAVQDVLRGAAPFWRMVRSRWTVTSIGATRMVGGKSAHWRAMDGQVRLLRANRRAHVARSPVLGVLFAARRGTADRSAGGARARSHQSLIQTGKHDPVSFPDRSLRAGLHGALGDRVADIGFHASQCDREGAGELGHALPPLLQRSCAHRRGYRLHRYVPETAIPQNGHQHVRIIERERATDARWWKGHAELIADSVQHQPEPRVQLPPIPRHRCIAPARSQYSNCLRDGLDRVLDEHQAVPTDHGVEAGIPKADRTLVEHRRAYLRTGARAACRYRDHLRGNV